MAESIVVDVAGLEQGYGRRSVIRGLDLAVGVGRMGLLGPNGAGKTTLIRTLATVLPPRRGTVTICGRQVRSEKDARLARRDVGYLPQEFGYYRGFSVYDFVRYCLWLREVPRRDAHAAAVNAIRAVGLSGRAGDRTGSLSGGLLRRAGIASAIAGSPRLLLLDEPTAGLDPAQRLEFRGLLRSLPDTAVVLTTHLVEDVAAVCDRVAVMAEGSVVFTGAPETLAAKAHGAPGDTPLERGYMRVLSDNGAGGGRPVA